MRKTNWLWAGLFYDLSKGCRFMTSIGWTVWSHVIIIGPIGFAVFWRRSTTKDSTQ